MLTVLVRDNDESFKTLRDKLLLIDYCHPGYNSSNGLQPCSPCPSCQYNDEYKQTSCFLCTDAHVENGTVGCTSSELKQPHIML